MGILSKLFHKEKQDRSPIPELLPILNQIKGNEFFTSIILPLQTAQTPQQLSTIMDDLREKISSLEMELKSLSTESSIYVEAIAQCRKIENMTFLAVETTYEHYHISEDFNSLEEQWKIIQLITSILTKMPDLYTPEELIALEELIYLMRELYELKLEIDALMPEFLSIEASLKSDIEAYTLAIQEASNKYKLSPDWSGKKQPLMNYGEQLKKRRESFIQKETIINKKINFLYDSYPEALVIYKRLSPIILKILERLLLQQKNSFNNQQQVQLSTLYNESSAILQLLESILETLPV